MKILVRFNTKNVRRTQYNKDNSKEYTRLSSYRPENSYKNSYHPQRNKIVNDLGEQFIH